MIAESIADQPVPAAVRRAELHALPPPQIEKRKDGRYALTREAAMWRYPDVFMAQLVDPSGTLLHVRAHHKEWLSLWFGSPLSCLLAPRDHGKSWTLIAFILWVMWRHNRDEQGRLKPSNPDGIFRVALFSATQPQAVEFRDRLVEIADANEALFGPGIVPGAGGNISKWRLRTVRSSTHLRLGNDADIVFRSFRGAARGLHPQLVALDDVLDEKNSTTDYQRRKVKRQFDSVIRPLVNTERGGQIIVVGTPQHQTDLLMLLRPGPTRRTGFVWRRFRAMNPDTKQVLWEEQHSRADLLERQAANAVEFSREFQCDPRDDASSYFPFKLTQPALDRGREMTLLTTYRRVAERPEYIVLGADSALSDTVGADYFVVWVVRVEIATGRRTIVWGYRDKGIPLPTQVSIIGSACQRFGVQLGCVEQNAFQKWLHDAMRLDPRCERVVGHNTAGEKTGWKEGVPSLVAEFHNQLWTIPTGDAQALELATVLQAELQAWGWSGGAEGKPEGTGEHDDTVLGLWLADRAYRMIVTLLNTATEQEVVTMKDMGIDRVQIGGDYA
jgi:hypothetical protein